MNNLRTITVFILITFLVVLMQYDLLKPVFEVGLTPEDRKFILMYKLLGPNPIGKIFDFWKEHGAYVTIPIYYIGTVQSITGFNYELIQIIGMILRTFAVLSIFPLILLLFKNTALAALTTIIFALSYTTTGALETGVEPSEYLGLFLMNLFLISYYYLNTKYLLVFKWLIMTSLLLFTAVIASIMRVYPLLFLLPLIELFLFLLNRTKYTFKYLVIKIIFLYLPFLFLMYLSPSSAGGHFSLPSILSRVAQGNWHILLTPLQGLGHIIPAGRYYGWLGLLNLENFENYFKFILSGPLVIFGVSSLILSWVSVKKKLRFFLRIFILNFAFEIALYWIVQHRLLLPPDQRTAFDNPFLYPVFYGLFLFSVMVNYMIDWYREGKKNNLFLLLWLGIFVALFFITLTYFFAGLGLAFGGAQDHYLLIPTIGISLFLSAVLLALYKRLSMTRLKAYTGFTIVVVFLIFLYILNREQTRNYFIGANFNGRAAAGQQLLQARIREKFMNLDYSKPMLVYFDTSDIPYGRGPLYSEGLLTPFPVLMYSQGEKVMSGCIGVIYENRQMTQLRKLITTIDNQQLLVYPTECVKDGKIGVWSISYKPENLYAFKITDGDFTDIKNEVLEELLLK